MTFEGSVIGILQYLRRGSFQSAAGQGGGNVSIFGMEGVAIGIAIFSLPILVHLGFWLQISPGGAVFGWELLLQMKCKLHFGPSVSKSLGRLWRGCSLLRSYR